MASVWSWKPTPEANGPRVCGVPALRERCQTKLESLGAEDLLQRRVQAGDRASGADSADGCDFGLVEPRPVAWEAVMGEERRIPPDRPEQRVRRQGLLPQVWALGPARSELERGHAALVRGGEPDPDLEPERPRDFLGEEASDRATVHSANELAAEPSEGQCVVAEAGPRIAAGLLRLEQADRPGARERVARPS